MKAYVISSLALLLAACHVDPQEPAATVDRSITFESECVGADCDDVDGSGTFCAGDLVCHRPTQGYRLPTTLPNGQRSCPPGFALKRVGPPNVGPQNACEVASAFAWPLECEIGCQGDVRLPVNPTIANGCCSYDYTRECEPVPACAADDATE